MRWARYFALITLPVAVAQVPGRGLALADDSSVCNDLLLFLEWLLHNSLKADGHQVLKRTNRLAAGLIVGMGVLGPAVSIALPVVLPVFSFPHPSGPYEIG